MKRALLLAAATLLVCAPAILRAGGPRYVAGNSYFHNGLAGQPITWANGVVVYSLDQGNLSPFVSNPEQDLIIPAFAPWTTVTTAAVSMQNSGSTLAEDVNGTNVTRVNGVLNIPADIASNATTRPLGIVYDADGSVTDALLGSGSSDPTLCDSNAVSGGADNLSPDAHFSHALLVLNARCIASSSDVPLFRYRLIRAIGRTLGLDNSQLNDNVFTSSPPPSSTDRAGFPMMHPAEPSCIAVSLSTCFPSPEQLRMDDRAAISRLYPVTTQNLTTGKQIFADATARITGSVRFRTAGGGGGQGMQGVNVVARLIDPATGGPSRTAAASSVSGFLFRGKGPNSVAGTTAANGDPLDKFGSSNTQLEGSFDLGGLELPNGASTADYQLSVEGINPLYTFQTGVGPYREAIVAASGTASPITVHVTRGATVTQDIVLTGGATDFAEVAQPHGFSSPRPLPSTGFWNGRIAPYGDEDFYALAVHGSRTMSLEVTSLNERQTATNQKMEPILGVWPIGSIAGDPPSAATTDFFNGGVPFTTLLRFTSLQEQRVKFGIVDARGDGRPDFAYTARLLYADSVFPGRIGTQGAPLQIDGVGFTSGMTATVGGTPATVLSLTPTQIFLSAPAGTEGNQDIVLTDPLTTASTSIIGGLTVGSAATDAIIALAGQSQPNVPVGTASVVPFRLQVVSTGTNVIPASGAQVTFSVAPTTAALSACGAATCVVSANDNGEAATQLTPSTTGTYTITARIANGSSATATVNATSAASEITALAPTQNFVSGTNATWPITVRLRSNGVPAVGQTVSFALTLGTVTLSSLTAVTDANGIASVTGTLPNFASTTKVRASIANGTIFADSIAQPIAASKLRLRVISGANQVITHAVDAQPILIRVTDDSAAQNPIEGVAVKTALNYYAYVPPRPVDTSLGDTGVVDPFDRKLLRSSSATLASDANGLITIPAPQVTDGTSTQVNIEARAASSALVLRLLSLAPSH